MTELEQLRLERDVLALNRNNKDANVFVILDGDDVVGVTWLATAQLPRWFICAT